MKSTRYTFRAIDKVGFVLKKGLVVLLGLFLFVTSACSDTDPSDVVSAEPIPTTVDSGRITIPPPTIVVDPGPSLTESSTASTSSTTLTSSTSSRSTTAPAPPETTSGTTVDLPAPSGGPPESSHSRGFGVPAPIASIGEANRKGKTKGDQIYSNTIVGQDQMGGIWCPPGSAPVRGVHVDMLSGTRKGHSMVAADLGRQIASTWHFAHLAGWDFSNSENKWEAIERFIAHAAGVCDRKELTEVPVFISGISRTGGLGSEVASKLPGRVLGYATVAAGVPHNKRRNDLMLATPGILIPGERDRGAEIVSNTVDFREQGARVAAAMNWGHGHTCKECEVVYFAFLDSLVRTRISASGQMGPPDDSVAWYGDPRTWTVSSTPAPGAFWLPDRHFAHIWQSFTIKKPTADFVNVPWEIQANPRRSNLIASELTELGAKIDGGANAEVTLYDGATVIAEATADDAGRVTFSNLSFEPGLHFLILSSGGRPVARPRLVVLY